MLSGLALLLLVCLNMRVQGKPRSQVGAASPPLGPAGTRFPPRPPPHPTTTTTTTTAALGHQDQELPWQKLSFEIVNSDGCGSICVSRVWLIPISTRHSGRQCNLLILWSCLRVEIFTVWLFLPRSPSAFIFLQHVDGLLVRLDPLPVKDSLTQARPGAVGMCSDLHCQAEFAPDGARVWAPDILSSSVFAGN